jgi:hypothetical protein
MSEALSSELMVSEIGAKRNISNESIPEGPLVMFLLRQVFHGYLCLAVVRDMRGISDLGEF